ncbi:MAG: DNA phosphorothioation system sulfurtransferase DndC, partial [Candidatus Bathyarchaeia archaeon]
MMEQNNKFTISIFEKRSLEDIHREIQQVYLADNRPWVIGYSGGKDSTTVLQLVWYALKALPTEKRQKMVYVISSDTLVE